MNIKPKTRNLAGLIALLALVLGSGWAHGESLHLHTGSAAWTGQAIEPPILQNLVDQKLLAPVEQRIPDLPHIVDPEKIGRSTGLHGGVLKMAMRRAKDTRQMVVYGYARLVVFNERFELEPDLLLKVEIEDQRKFTFWLRPGHRWSDGHEFTSEDFRYWWEDVANNPELYPAGPPRALIVDGTPAKVSYPTRHKIVYEWPKPNPYFLPALAGAAALYVYMPAHYMRSFHERYQTPEQLDRLAIKHHQKNWAALHNKLSKAYKNENAALPSLQPWVLQPSNSTIRFVFRRNPWFHRLDHEGRQLPYLDGWVFNIVESKLIALKAATGEVDLQGRYLSFKDIALLKQSEQEFPIRVSLWKHGSGAHLALVPNLNHDDVLWRSILRDVRFRRALSLGTNRFELSRVLYFGLALHGQNTVLPESPLYIADYRTKWTEFDPASANALLDAMGLTERNSSGIRLLPDGRALELTIEIADSGTEQADILSLIKDHWHDIGVGLFIKPTSLEVLRRRTFAGMTMMTLAKGVENGLASPKTSPAGFAPTSQIQYQWSGWGQYFETAGQSGVAPDMPQAIELLANYRKWAQATSTQAKSEAWRQILAINSDYLFTIGLLAGTSQPIVAAASLRNVPEEAIWNWDPGAHFGVYRPDLFWFDDEARRQGEAGRRP